MPGPCAPLWSLSGRDVNRLHALPALGRLVGHLGALFEGLEPTALYAGVVDEEILAPIIRRDKAVALLIAEPLHRSLGHAVAPTFLFLGLNRLSAAQCLQAAPHRFRPSSSL